MYINRLILNFKEIQKKWEYMNTYGWFALLYSRNWHSSVKHLYSNKKKEEYHYYNIHSFEKTESI